MKGKQNSIMLLRELLVTQMNHWTFFPVYLTIVVILSDISESGTPKISFWLLSGVVPFLFYLARTGLKFFWMLLVHIAVLGIYVVLPFENAVIKVIQLTVALVYVIYSIVLWVKEREKKDARILPLLMVGLSVACVYMLHHQEHGEWDFTIITCLIAVIGLYFINYYVEQYQNFLTVNQSSAGHIPAQEMFRSGMGLVVGYTGVGILLLIFISNGQWLLTILNACRWALSLLVRGLQALFPYRETQGEELTVNEKVDMAGDMMAGLEPGEGFWLWQVLEYVIIFVFLALFVLVLVKGLVSLFRLLLKLMKRSNYVKNDTREASVVDVREKCEIIRGNQLKKNFSLWNLNSADRIRHLYKKRLLASQSLLTNGNGKEKLNLFTARESGTILKREELSGLYEKARYSREECSSEDVRHMKTACK